MDMTLPAARKKTRIEVLDNAETGQLSEGVIRVPSLFATWQVPFQLRARILDGGVALAFPPEKNLEGLNLVVEAEGGEVGMNRVVGIPGIIELEPVEETLTEGERVLITGTW
ncbi:MAG TPA: hypothetical protein VKA48_07735 [Gammaproteobacteria bacterium]|nr:hypothetical protein [Gammaproteobacteria bacterium]